MYLYLYETYHVQTKGTTVSWTPHKQRYTHRSSHKHSKLQAIPVMEVSFRLCGCETRYQFWRQHVSNLVYTQTSFSPCTAGLFHRRHFVFYIHIFFFLAAYKSSFREVSMYDILSLIHASNIFIRNKSAFQVDEFLSYLPLCSRILPTDSWMLPVRIHYCSWVHSNVATWTICSRVVTSCTDSFNTLQFYVLPTQCIYVFCVDLRTNSDYFPIQH